VCSLEDSSTFLSASEDGTIRLWDTTPALDLFAKNNEKDEMLPSTSFTLISDKTPCIEKISRATFIGHSRSVLSVACADPGVAFLSGSEDKTARLWSAGSGTCLRVFGGHTGPVTTVAVVDKVTFLTGSKDTTIKVWDAFAAGCIRTYTGHVGAVTSVSSAEDGTFISSSEDLTIKLWVFTAVSPIQSEDILHDIFDAKDGLYVE
jgi:WD40 repeat protein